MMGFELVVGAPETLCGRFLRFALVVGAPETLSARILVCTVAFFFVYLVVFCYKD